MSVVSSKSKQSKRGIESLHRRLNYDHGQNYVDPTPPKLKEHNPKPQKSKFVLSASKMELERSNTETASTMIQQIKAISELTAVLNSYSGMKNLKQDIEMLDEIFTNLQVMPAQIETIALIFNSSEEQTELAQRSSELREEAK